MYGSKMLFDPMRYMEAISKLAHNDKEEVRNDGFLPKIDIINEDKKITIFADMPGISKDDIKIVIDDENVMTISGSKRKDEEVKSENERTYYRTERKFGEFTRKILLPETYDESNIKADFVNGVLKINIGIKESELPKQIEVNIN